MAAKEKRPLVTAAITPEAYQAVDSVADQMGMQKYVLCSRLMIWFAQLQKDARNAIVGDVTPAAAVELFEMIFRDAVAREVRESPATAEERFKEWERARNAAAAAAGPENHPTGASVRRSGATPKT